MLEKSATPATAVGSSADWRPFLENVVCPSCGKDETKTIFREKYPAQLNTQNLLSIYKSSSDVTLMDRLVECRHCHLQYLSPRIRADIILESYKEAEDQVFTTQNEERIATFRRSLLWIMGKTGLQASRNVKLLDVGCAGGAFPKAAHDLGFSVVGIEPSQFLAKNAAQTYGLDIRAGTLHEQKLASESFDMITLWDVLEHLTDPQAVLAEIHRLLKPQGILVVNYPDGQSYAARLLGAKWPFYLSVHLIYFSPKTIRSFLAQSRFQVLKLKPFFQTLKLGYVFKRAAAYFSIFSLFEKGVTALGLGQIPLRYNMGQTIVIAQKK